MITLTKLKFNPNSVSNTLFSVSEQDLNCYFKVTLLFYLHTFDFTNILAVKTCHPHST